MNETPSKSPGPLRAGLAICGLLLCALAAWLSITNGSSILIWIFAVCGVFALTSLCTSRAMPLIQRICALLPLVGGLCYTIWLVGPGAVVLGLPYLLTGIVVWYAPKPWLTLAAAVGGCVITAYAVSQYDKIRLSHGDLAGLGFIPVIIVLFGFSVPLFLIFLGSLIRSHFAKRQKT